MKKKHWLIAIIILIIILAIGFWYWRLDREDKTVPTAPVSEIKTEAAATGAKPIPIKDKAAETNAAKNKNSNTIPLEKPPFIQD